MEARSIEERVLRAVQEEREKKEAAARAKRRDEDRKRQEAEAKRRRELEAKVRTSGFSAAVFQALCQYMAGGLGQAARRGLEAKFGTHSFLSQTVANGSLDYQLHASRPRASSGITMSHGSDSGVDMLGHVVGVLVCWCMACLLQVYRAVSASL